MFPATLLKWVYRLFKHFLSVAGLIKPFSPKGEYAGDIDQLFESGAYMCRDTSVSSSTSLPFITEMFALYSFDATESKFFKLQIAVDMSTSKNLEVKIRRFRSSWTDWKTLSLS